MKKEKKVFTPEQGFEPQPEQFQVLKMYSRKNIMSKRMRASEKE